MGFGFLWVEEILFLGQIEVVGTGNRAGGRVAEVIVFFVELAGNRFGNGSG